MKQIAIYECSDGTRFDDATKAESYESICRRVRDAMGPLSPFRDGYQQYRQLSKQECDAAKAQIVAICRELWPQQPVFQHPADKIHPASFAGRWIDDCRYPCLKKAWFVFQCVNWESYRQYDQPFYALNEWEAAGFTPA